MKLTFGIITLNADFFIRQVLESIYPFAHCIIVADGATEWWQKQGVFHSTDNTLDIIKSFPDPDKKIKLVSASKCREKDELCRKWFEFVPADTDYVFCNDADEVHAPENIERLIRFLEKENPTSVGFKSDSFYGGFDRIIGGFEREHSFKRVLKYVHGCFYRTHRQPTLAVKPLSPGDVVTPYHKSPAGNDIEGTDITGNQLYNETGITMWHGSYVSPVGVRNKIMYYEGAVISPGKCIPHYFNDVWLNWVLGNDLQRSQIEHHYSGVHEFIPEARGESYTQSFAGIHPPAIIQSLHELKNKFQKELIYVQELEQSLKRQS